MKKLLSLLLLIGLIAAVTACGGDDDDDSGAESTNTGDDDSAGALTLRLGYFPNITHAQALVGLEDGTFAESLGSNVTLEPVAFNSGTEVITAIFAGEIDLSYIGPNPTINGYVQSDGEAVRVIAGATSGGALLVVRPDAGIEEAADFAGKKVATPSLGNTQDVALRNWLLDNGLASRENGGDVQVIPTANPDALTLFQQGEIDAAWVPEPWATRLVQEADGEIFLDERDLWDAGQFVTTQLIAETGFLEEHPDTVRDFLSAHIEITQFIQDNPEEAKTLVNQGIESATGEPLPQEVIDAAWENIEPTFDPIASSLRESAAAAFELEFLEEEPNLENLYALELLNEILAELGLDPVEA
ncbi:MAG: ABC transporter substrate-binding protein [Dehalococcoidia bacterium]